MKSCHLQEAITEKVIYEHCIVSLVHDSFKGLLGSRTVSTINERRKGQWKECLNFMYNSCIFSDYNLKHFS